MTGEDGEKQLLQIGPNGESQFVQVVGGESSSGMVAITPYGTLEDSQEQEHQMVVMETDEAVEELEPATEGGGPVHSETAVVKETPETDSDGKTVSMISA